MGQKIHPTGFRLAVTRNWGSRWYAGNNNFADMLNEDLKVRAYLKTKLKNASVGRVVIERSHILPFRIFRGIEIGRARHGRGIIAREMLTGCAGVIRQIEVLAPPAGRRLKRDYDIRDAPGFRARVPIGGLIERNTSRRRSAGRNDRSLQAGFLYFGIERSTIGAHLRNRIFQIFPPCGLLRGRQLGDPFLRKRQGGNVRANNRRGRADRSKCGRRDE